MQLFLSLSLVGISFDTKTVQAVDFGVKSKIKTYEYDFEVSFPDMLLSSREGGRGTRVVLSLNQNHAHAH